MMTARLQSNIECASSGGFSGGGQGHGFGVSPPDDGMITSAHHPSLPDENRSHRWVGKGPSQPFPGQAKRQSHHFSIKLTELVFGPHLYPLHNKRGFTQEHKYVIFAAGPFQHRQPLLINQ
jgi:hypothetical protein